MQRAVITFVSLLAVLIHVHIGCCAHHEHVAKTPKAVPQGCPFHGHEHDHGQSPTPASPLSHDDCHESHCSVLLVSSASVAPASADGWWLPLSMTDPEISSRAGLPTFQSGPADALRPPPLRAHLLLGVILI